MTGIQTNVSPVKGTPQAEGRRLRNFEIVQALQGNAPRKQGKARKISIVWISSGEEDGGSNSVAEDTDDEDLVESMGGLSVKHRDSKRSNVDLAPHETHNNPSPRASLPASSLPEYSAIATPPQTPARRALLTSTPTSSGPSAPPGPPVTPAPATPGRQGKFNAYVVYLGQTPYFYANWPTVNRMLQADRGLVFKGFYTLEKAREAWTLAKNSGVIAAMRNGAGRPYWSVTEGVNPAVYNSVYAALKVGLEWGGGCLKGWNNEEDAVEDWNDKAGASPSRIIVMPSPNLC